MSRLRGNGREDDASASDRREPSKLDNDGSNPSSPSKYQGLRCWFCGMQAESMDHIVARRMPVARKQRKRLKREAMSAFGRNTMPACHPCNSLKTYMTIEEFRAELKRCAPVDFYKSADMRFHRLARRISEFDFKFYGERGTVDATFPIKGESEPFSYRWKAKAERGTGNQHVRIEECAKRGKKAETLAGLMNGK